MSDRSFRDTCGIVNCGTPTRLNGQLCDVHAKPPGLYWARLRGREDWTVIEVHDDGRSDSIGWDAGAFPAEIGEPAVRIAPAVLRGLAHCASIAECEGQMPEDNGVTVEWLKRVAGWKDEIQLQAEYDARQDCAEEL